MAVRIDFSKDTVKGKPTSVRFVEKHLDLVKEAEALKTPQQVVDFLLNKYWFERKFGINPILAQRDNHKATPPETPKEDKTKNTDAMPDPTKDKGAYLKWLKNQ